MQGFVDRSGGFNQCLQVSVAKLLLQETGTYNPQYFRPYEMHADGVDINNIVNRIANYGSGQINGQLLSGVAGHILQPKAHVEGEIHIPQGWMEKRVRFVMEVHCQHTFSNVVYYIQGYTNFAGITNDAVAPDMLFIVNSVQGVTRSVMMTPSGQQVVDIPTDSFQVVMDSNRLTNMAGQFNMQGDRKFMMRPHDIFTGMHTDYIRNAYDGHGQGNIIDNRSELRTDPVRSSRSYGVPTNYIANVVDKYTHATELLEYGQNTQDALSTARQSSMDAMLSENPFIRMISDRHGCGTTNTFSYADLNAIDPNTYNVTTIIVTPTVHAMTVHHAGQTAYWHGSDRLTQVASTLSQSVPAIMMDLMISKWRFRVTNHDIGGQVNYVLIDFRGLTNMDMTINMRRLEERLKNEILFDMSFGNQEPYMIEMAVDMFGDTSMDITMYGETVRYVTPSFCDNLTVPVIAGSEQQFNNVVTGFDMLLNQVVGELNDNKHAPRPIRI